MTYILGQKSATPAAAGFGINVTASSFNKEVIEASLKTPVVVLFTLARDPNCQKFDAQLTALLKDYEKQVLFARADVSDPALLMMLQRFGMQGVPAVFVLHGGQMLDGFAGIMPERELKTFFAALFGKPQRLSAQMLADAHKAFEAGDYITASNYCSELLVIAPDDIKALSLLAECYMGLQQLDQAQTLLDKLTPAQQAHPDTARARTRLAFLRKLAALPAHSTDAVEQALLLAKQHQDTAACDALMALIKNADIKPRAIAALNDLFTVMGNDTPVVAGYRKKLTQMLF